MPWASINYKVLANSPWLIVNYPIRYNHVRKLQLRLHLINVKTNTNCHNEVWRECSYRILY